MHSFQWGKTRFAGPFLHWSAPTRMSLCSASLEGAFPQGWAKPFFLLAGNSSAGMLNPNFLTTACRWWLAPGGLWQGIFSPGELKWSRSRLIVSVRDPIPLSPQPPVVQLVPCRVHEDPNPQVPTAALMAGDALGGRRCLSMGRFGASWEARAEGGCSSVWKPAKSLFWSRRGTLFS